MPSLSKSSWAYGGWSSGLIGGILIGFGIIILVIAPLIVNLNEEWTAQINDILDLWRTWHPSDDLPTAHTPSGVYLGFANAQLLGAIAIFIGLIVGAIGIYEIRSSLKTVSPQPLVTASVGKKYCRYCGTENKDDAVFCEKCGKGIK